MFRRKWYSAFYTVHENQKYQKENSLSKAFQYMLFLFREIFTLLLLNLLITF